MLPTVTQFAFLSSTADWHLRGFVGLPALPESPERLRMQCRRRGLHAAGGERRLCAVEIGEYAARLTHDDGQRCDVQDVDVGLDHDVQCAACQQVVMAEIAVAAHA